jgi:hypothetical protein
MDDSHLSNITKSKEKNTALPTECACELWFKLVIMTCSAGLWQRQWQMQEVPESHGMTLHCKIEGQAAYDILTHVEQHWRKATRWHTTEAIQFTRIQWIFSHQLISLLKDILSCTWPMTMNLEAIGILRYSSRGHHFVSLCCILKPLNVEHNWVLNSGSIVQGALRFWSVNLLSLCFCAKCEMVWCYAVFIHHTALLLLFQQWLYSKLT